MGAKEALKERGYLGRAGGGEQSLCSRNAELPSGPWLTPHPHPGEAQPLASAPIGCRACRGYKARSSGSGRLQLPHLLLLPCPRSEMGTRFLLLLLGLSLLLGLLQGEPLLGIWEGHGDWV